MENSTNYNFNNNDSVAFGQPPGLHENNIYFNLPADKDSIMNNIDLSDYRQNFDFDFNEPADKNIIPNNNIKLSSESNMNINEKKDEMIPIKDYKTNYTNYPIDKKKKTNKKGQINFLGRKKRTDSESGKHNKFCDDNLRKKCKHLVLDTALNFINGKIKEIFNGDIGEGAFIKKLLILNQKQKSESSIQYNKDFLKKSLGEIFSEKISSKYTKYNPSHNYYLIKALTNDKNENKNYFKKLFNITFIDCLKHFIESKKIEELEGLDTFEKVKTKFKDEEDYLKCLSYYIMNYEDIINNKRARIRKENKKEKKISQII